MKKSLNLSGRQTVRDVRNPISGFYCVTFHWGLRPNTLLFTGKEGTLVVDPGQIPVAGGLVDLVSSFENPRVRFIINTHPHGDHTGANKIFGNDVPLLCFENLNALASNGLLELQPGPFPQKAGKYFSRSYSFRFNDTVVLLIPSEGIHSMQDIIVYFPEKNIVHMGDLLLTQSFPAIGYRVKQYIRFLEIVLLVFPEATIFAGGHGLEMDKKSLLAYKEMLIQTVDCVLKEVKSGRKMSEIMKRDTLQKWSEYGEYISFITKDYWIESIVRSYQKY